MEKFITFKIGNLHFKDSAQFLTTSLDKLVANLKAKAIKENNIKGIFSTTWKYFQTNWKHLPETAFELLTKKGVYPYTYMDSFDRFTEEQLPPKQKYYSDLSLKDISDEDYKFAHQLWETYGLKNLGELHDLYCETDVMLLADIFENIRKLSLENYKLDPTHFCTAPGLSWSAALKYTKIQLELLTDPDMSLFIDKGLVGGISLIANHYAKANSPGLKDYNPNDPNSYLMLLDCNNQYGWAMSEPLPHSGFQWADVDPTVKDWSGIVQSLKDDSDTGYIFEVDLEYPQELHDLHDTYPLAPEHLTIQEGMLSPYQKQLADDLGIKIGGDKLCLTLNNKKKYICHYRNLKQYLELGLKIQKVHRILKFNQSTWLKQYIDLNTGLRKKANSKFEEDFAKLMNNSFFGKTCETHKLK